MGNDAYHNMMDGDKVDRYDAWEYQEEERWRRELVHECDNDFDRFPLPICFDPHEEQKQLNLRKWRIEQLIDRFLRRKRNVFNKKYHPQQP